MRLSCREWILGRPLTVVHTFLTWVHLLIQLSTFNLQCECTTELCSCPLFLSRILLFPLSLPSQCSWGSDKFRLQWPCGNRPAERSGPLNRGQFPTAAKCQGRLLLFPAGEVQYSFSIQYSFPQFFVIFCYLFSVCCVSTCVVKWVKGLF